jgi:hypothetical protein
MFVSEKFMGDVPGYFPVCSAAFGAPASSTACSGEISFRAGAVPGAPATSANIGRNEIETFIIRLRKISKTTEKMLSVWFDIGATVPKLNSFRWKPS